MGVVHVLAHPLTQRAELPLAPVELAAAALYILLVVAAVTSRHLRKRPPPTADPVPHDDDPTPAAAPLRFVFWFVRAIGLAVFVLVMVAGARGNTTQVRNVAPAWMIGAGWPLMTALSMLLGGVWWWVNPYDTLARMVSPLGAGTGSGQDADRNWPAVWWALVPAALWMGYVTAWPSALSPPTIAAVFSIYTVLTLAGCLAFGRRTWLWRAEFFTVFFGLLAATRTRGVRWEPPAGAPALLGVIAGGAVFGIVRDSDIGGFAGYGTTPVAFATLFMAVGAVLAGLIARRTMIGALAVALAPVSTALVIALSMERNRLTTSLQLLPTTASDPFGSGLDLFGTATNAVNPAPLGVVGPVWVQVVILLIGAVAGAMLAQRYAARRRPLIGDRSRPRRVPGIVFAVVGMCLAFSVAAAAAI